MARYIVKRILLLIPVIIAVSLLVFIMMDMAPGDLFDVMGGDFSPEVIQQMKHDMGYDRSVFYRYFLYMRNLVQGNLGMSYTYKQPVWELYQQRLPNTIILAVAGLILALIVAIPLGMLASLKAGSLVDNFSMAAALIGVSMPNFWCGLMLILLFSLKLKLLPSGGFDEGLRSLILPAFTVAIHLLGLLTRTTRSSMLDTIRQDYLDTARSKGVAEKTVIWKHAFRNALIPIITVAGTQLGACIGGAVVTETIFTWPGVGRLTIDAVNSRDTTLVTGCIIMTTFLVSVLMLLVDLLYALVDPRIKARYARGRSRL